ncbi:dnaJ homolog subfamily C member 21 [Folsomia candida]|uniref:DnaJ subfamily C member 21 n=1 Tax=Folsomia candida TaxID=158441 RepID=A0A226DJH9_FOLCA|nr:dnaJ homolog subfamily C member 21 [Folsomia candida]OXA45692.1 DnaJ subfamily C member 21 [Folsomia candida]
MPPLKKCYYEVLGVERNAGDDEIKKSFRKLALQLHPDKNPDRADEAKAEFQVLQQAYEVLSNPQERSWYDLHRQAVLREGLDPDFDDFNIDLMAYCTSSCYKGFGDDDEGFYAVYRNLFAKLTTEELEAGWADEHDDDIPNFGDSQSSYEEVVGTFYGFWESFCTMKSFAWNDEYDTRRAECRRIARLMDKENKKIRTDGKKAWNREVRALVDFVKRKDKRVQAWKALQEVRLKEKEEEISKKAKEAKSKRLAERKKLLESVKSHKAKNESLHQPVLREMEQWMSNEFGEQLSGDSDEEAPTCFHCAACNKSFRTEKAFTNHEKSKKHLQEVEKLRELMKEEDELFQDSETEDVEDEGNAEEEEEHDVDDGPEEHVVDETTKKVEDLHIKNDSKDQQESAKSENESEEEKVDEEDDDDLLQKQFLARATKKKNGRNPVFFTNEDSDNELAPPINTLLSSDEDDKPKKKPNSKKAKKPKKPKATNPANATTTANSAEAAPVIPKPTVDNSDGFFNSSDLTCIICNEKFSSRSQLFRHIKATGHAVPLEVSKKVKEAPLPGEKVSKKQRRGKKTAE